MLVCDVCPFGRVSGMTVLIAVMIRLSVYLFTTLVLD